MVDLGLGRAGVCVCVCVFVVVVVVVCVCGGGLPLCSWPLWVLVVGVRGVSSLLKVNHKPDRWQHALSSCMPRTH